MVETIWFTGSNRIIRWNTLVRRVELVTAVIEGNLPYPRTMVKVHEGVRPMIQSSCKIIWQRFLWLWYMKLEHTFMRYCSVIMWIFSVLILWSEVREFLISSQTLFKRYIYIYIYEVVLDV